MPSRWYAIEPTGRFVINEPFRSRIDIYRALMDRQLESPNGVLASVWLGWPNLTKTAACICAVLADRASRDLDEIHAAVGLLLESQGWGKNSGLKTYYVATGALRRRGFVSVNRRGRNPGSYSITRAAIAERRGPCPYVARRGDEIADRFPGFAKKSLVDVEHLPDRIGG